MRGSRDKICQSSRTGALLVGMGTSSKVLPGTPQQLWPDTRATDQSRVVAGYLETLSDAELAGRLLNRKIGKRRLTVSVTIDRADTFTTDIDSNNQSNLGFRFKIPQAYRDGRSHDVEFFDYAGDPLILLDVKSRMISHSFKTSPLHPPVTAVFENADRLILTLDGIDDQGVNGWGYREAEPLIPARMHVHIDGHWVAEVPCDQRREDVRQSGHPNVFVGFAFPIPDRYHDDSSHTLELRANGADTPVLLKGLAAQTGNRVSFKLPSVQYFGHVDGLHEGAIRGWAIQRDYRTGKCSGGLQVLVLLKDQPVAQITANQFRADVAEALNVMPDCGFSFIPPLDFVADKTLDFQFKLVPGGFELENSPYRATFPGLDLYVKMRELITTAEALFTQTWALREKMKALLPAVDPVLADYDAWARRYHERLAARPAPALPPGEALNPPLVSIVCPVYRPRLVDFTAAIESVIAQSYQNWQLILVDDASCRPALEARIKSFATRDARIRPFFNSHNGGISFATNTGLSAAQGRYVMFFDHDDLLAPRALEYMVEAALRTGAKLLYCDEDKIDDAGAYSEPSLKPDWNPRLLLAQNYICHILFVERAQLEKAGKFRSECDGAQDHDMTLRLAGFTPPAQVHHVPEILYHWRKTPFSTAESGKAKAYTSAAGVRAVSDHLSSRGLDAVVQARDNTTTYEVVWRPKRHPDVTVIIPYREHVEVTQECLHALRTRTNYDKFEVLLVDNWSSSKAAAAFAAAQERMPRTRVIRIEETFNFSRINNIAAAASTTEFLLFMNNDVLVRDPDWLSQMLGEALASADIGIVGSKLLYPNGLVQHGGVILGVGGVADHAYRGLEKDAPGYMGRAVCAQDLTAVTAACLLCRREVFERIGGFDEVDLHVAFNDVDFCLKAVQSGHRVVWTPNVVMEHRESLSRGNDLEPQHQVRFFHENAVMEKRWRHILPHDPHYNPHFSRRGGIFTNLAPPHETG